jgi:hypothetical protein
MPNYAETWAKSWMVMVPDDGSGSESSDITNRSIRMRAGFSLDYSPVGVELSFEGNSAASIPLFFTQFSSTARIEAPFSFGAVHGRVQTQRNISQSSGYAKDTIMGDITQYGQNFADSSPMWLAIPVYALFDPYLEDTVDKSLSNYAIKPENIRFQETVSLNLFFPERYDLLSLIIPVSHYTQFDRSLEQRLDTRLDVLTISTGFGFSSINLFGAMGSKPLFKFYRNDELRHSVSALVSIPRGEDPLWRMQAEQNLRFFGFNEAELGIQNTLTLTGGYRTILEEYRKTGWIESFILLWTIPREKTLLSSLYSAGMKKIAQPKYFPALNDLAQNEHEKFLRESLELVIDNSGEYGVYSFLLGHESVVRIIGRLTLTGFAKIGVQRDVYSDILSIQLNFGTTLTVSF